VQADHHDRHDARGGGQEREQDLVQKAGEVPAVGGVGEEPDIDAEPPRFERSADASMRLGRRRSMGSIAASSSIAVLLRVSGVNWSASWSEAKRRASATTSKPGASWVSEPSMVASARKTAAISGGTASP
jgi:hypothetical protein